MGCPCEIQLFTGNRNEAERIAKIAITDVQRLERRYSRYLEDSLLSRINRVALQGGSINVDEETASLLNYAETCYRQSDGLFDITSGVLRQAWRFDQNRLPSRSAIEQLLPKVGWDKLRWTPPSLAFLVSGMDIDFGGIVKEYAADRAAVLCKEAGAQHGVVNLGGDIALIGPRADRRPWAVGIHHPRQTDGVLMTLSMHIGAVASSGDYQRCMVVGDTHYSHILNPKTGWPTRHLAAVTVVSEYCVVAGSAATIAMLKEDQGPSWLEELDLPHLWVDTSGRCGGTLLKNKR
ncbi:MAG: FAD:protein FMN transferase [Gammaproteobacteria bacterium]